MKLLYTLYLIASAPFVIAETTEGYATTETVGKTESYSETESIKTTENISTTDGSESQSATEETKITASYSSIETPSTSKIVKNESHVGTESIETTERVFTAESIRKSESQSATEPTKTAATTETNKATEIHSSRAANYTNKTLKTTGEHLETESVNSHSRAMSMKKENPDLMENIITRVSILDEVGFVNVSSQCEQDYRMFLQGLMDFKPWALRMFDSTAKFAENFMELSNYNLGNFDECISIQVPEENFRGKYCLVYVFVQQNVALKGESDLLKVLTKKMDTDKNSFPALGVYMGTCIPKSCSPLDWMYIFNNVLKNESIPLGGITIDNACTTEDEEIVLTDGDWAAVGVFSFFVIITILSTIYDVLNKRSERRNELYLAFSVYTNGKKLISMSASDGSFDCLHGIRFLTIAWITLGHTKMTNICMASSINRRYQYDQWKNPAIMYLSGATLAVDTFLLLSGFLVSYSVLKQVRNMMKVRDFNVPLFYLYRFIRITAPLIVVVIFEMTLIRHLGSGPSWKVGIGQSRDSCLENWWSSMIHIQNYYNPDKLCLDQLWYVSVDTQLYLLSPILLIPLWRKPRLGLLLTFFFLVLSLASTFGVAYYYKLSPSYITSDPETYENFINKYYYGTHTRCGPWIVGIILGYIIVRALEKKTKLSKVFVTLGWLFFVALSLSSMYVGNIMYQPTYVYNVWECSFYIALYRVGFTTGIAWIIYACILGYGGPANKLLSLKVWFPFSRLTYCIYLLQVTVIYSRTYSLHTNPYVSDLTMFSDFFGNLALCIMGSIPLSLMFEAPSIALGKILIGVKKTTTQTVVPENHHGQRTG